MIIWILALLILAAVAAAGFYQGVVRALFSLVGILVGALLAVPLSSPFQSLLKIGGMEHPIARQIFAPAVVFLIILIVFKVVAHSVNTKVEYIFNYRRTDQERMYWERFNHRTGLCVGLLNGTIYFLLLMIPIYTFGYLTTQLASGSEDPTTVRVLNTARAELTSTKMDRVVGAVAPAKPAVYEAMDIVGLIYKNPLLESRISRYPPILTLAERGEFQELANDVEFHNLWQSGAKIADLLNYPKVHAITANAALMADVQQTLLPDLKDLQSFLKTGKSEKYDSETILGRWELDLAATFNGEKARRQNFSAVELKQLRSRLLPFYGATLTATTDGKVLLKRGDESPVPQGQSRTMAQGTWKKEGSGYQISLDDKPVEMSMDAGKLLIDRNGIVFVFEKEI